MTVAACQRQMELGIADEWVPPTLLGNAFDTEDVGTARKWVDEVNDENYAEWKLHSTLDDIHTSIELVTDSATKSELAEIAEELVPFVSGDKD